MLVTIETPGGTHVDLLDDGDVPVSEFYVWKLDVQKLYDRVQELGEEIVTKRILPILLEEGLITRNTHAQ